MMRLAGLPLAVPILLSAASAAEKKIRVLVWSERTEPAAVYPDGINGAVAGFLQKDSALQVETANITDPDLGVSDAVLDQTDVLIWFRQIKHAEVSEAVIKTHRDACEGKRHGIPATAPVAFRVALQSGA